MIKLTTEREITPYVWVHPEDDRSRVVASTASPARPSSRRNFASRAMHSNGRGRDEDYSSPPAQIPACAANAPGFPRVKRRRHMVLKLHALRRTAANRIDVASRLSVRTTAACRLFPSGEALPSTTSAGSCLPLFGRFLGTTASSDFSSAYMLGVRLLPSRAGPEQVRARVRPPRFRTKNFTTCARPSTARGSAHASQYAMGDVAFSSEN